MTYQPPSASARDSCATVPSGSADEFGDGSVSAGVELGQRVSATPDRDEPRTRDPLGHRPRVLVRRQRVVLGGDDKRRHRERLKRIGRKVEVADVTVVDGPARTRADREQAVDDLAQRGVLALVGHESGRVPDMPSRRERATRRIAQNTGWLKTIGASSRGGFGIGSGGAR